MGSSVSVPLQEPPGTFQHAPSGSTVRIFWKDGRMHHQLEERGLSADYPIAYAIGAGNVGTSYLVDLDGHLFQSPAAYYTSHSEWNTSPGYESERVLDFSRSITPECLVCHAGAVKKSSGKTELTAISCERCHGPGENHRQHPYPGTIVNPAKLPIRERDSVCEQCHLEGATVVLNPGKYWWDFRPGQPLEDVETDYVFRSENGFRTSIGAVSQAEQLTQSACFRGSVGKLWCGTCHDPHGMPVNRKQQMKEICSSCHAATQLATTHSSNFDDCVGCHMTRRQARDVAHAAVTDHRIARRPEVIVDAKVAKVLVAWHKPKPELIERNLGLASFYAAKREQSLKDYQRAFQLLSGLPLLQKDGAVSAAEGYMLLGSGGAQKAIECFERAVHAEPQSAEYWLDLAVAENGSGNSAAAVQAFRRSIENDPYDYRPYKALRDLYVRTNQPEQSRAVVAEFLQRVPQSIVMRLSR